VLGAEPVGTQQRGPDVWVVQPAKRRPDPAGLTFAGWNVIHIGLDDDLDAVVAAHPSVFGQVQR